MKLLAIAEKHDIKNVTFVDPIPKQRVPDYLAAIDVSLVLLKKPDTFKTVIPSKIFEAAAMGLPILLGVEGQAQKIVEKYDVGVCFEPENTDSFLTKLRLLRDNKELYKKLSKNGLRLAKAYDRSKLALKMLDALKKMV